MPSRLKVLARLTAALGFTYVVFQLAFYLWLNSPDVARERMDRANDQIVARVSAIYRASGWPGFGPLPGIDPFSDDAPVDDSADCFCADP